MSNIVKVATDLGLTMEEVDKMAIALSTIHNIIKANGKTGLTIKELEIDETTYSFVMRRKEP